MQLKSEVSAGVDTDYMDQQMQDSLHQYNGNITIATVESVFSNLKGEGLEDVLCAGMDKDPVTVTLPLSVISSNLSQHSSSILKGLDPGLTMMASEATPSLMNSDPNGNSNFIPPDLIDRYQTEIDLQQCENSEIRIIDENLGDGRTLLVRQFNQHEQNEQYQIQLEMNPLLGEIEAQPAPRDEDLPDQLDIIKSENDFMLDKSFSDYPENFMQMESNELVGGTFQERDNYLMEKIDIKDLKLLKPITANTGKEERMSSCNYHSHCKYSLVNYDHANIKPTQWFSQMPRPMSMNTFDLRYLGGSSGFKLASQRKIIEV